MRHTFFNGNWEVHNNLVVRCRLPDIDNSVANFKCEFGFCTREAFGGIFKAEVALGLAAVLLAELCALNSDLDDVLLGLPENLFTLCNGGGIVKMNDSVLAALERFKGLCDDMLS